LIDVFVSDFMISLASDFGAFGRPDPKVVIQPDPYYQDTLLALKSGPLGVPLKNLDGPGKTKKGTAGQTYENADSADKEVFKKLQELDKVLSKTNNPHFDDPAKSKIATSPKEDVNHERLAQLEQMMAGLGEEDEPVTEVDPEMTELNGMLDKIMQIQNPELQFEHTRKQSLENRKQVFPVTTVTDQMHFTLLGGQSEISDSLEHGKQTQPNGFHSLENQRRDMQMRNAIEAVIDQNQTLVTGATIKFRLTTDIFIAGTHIPAGSFLYGKASLNQERLRANIESVKSGNSLFPVSLSVYDMDGMEGIYVPGALSRDVGKQFSDRAIQGINIPIIDPSLGAQAASAGIEAAKTFLGWKTKLIQVSVKAGYKVLLKDANAKSV
jgi:conjugative transposon TraM protein